MWTLPMIPHTHQSHVNYHKGHNELGVLDEQYKYLVGEDHCHRMPSLVSSIYYAMLATHENVAPSGF